MMFYPKSVLKLWQVGLWTAVSAIHLNTVLGQETIDSATIQQIRSEVEIRQARLEGDNQAPKFQFPNMPAPVKNDLASQAKFSLVAGRSDANSGSLAVLHDDRLPQSADAPSENFFFNTGDRGGRILVDLGSVQSIQQINTFSCHPGSRGPQVYSLFASDGQSAEFQPQPDANTNLQDGGWTLIAKVDTRPETGNGGGQHAVSIAAKSGPLGNYRYVLLEIVPTRTRDRSSNTFFSEIDIVAESSELTPIAEPPAPIAAAPVIYEIEGGKYRFSLDVAQAPDLEPWVKEQLVPVIQTWYPKIIELLPTEDFDPPQQFSITFYADMDGVAHVQGTRMSCAANWFRKNLDGEAKGSVVHELVHVVQQYGQARRANRRASPTPGWVVEGVADYIRWFLYEPESGGAAITRRGLAGARYDGNYRITANFLDWVVREVQPDMIKVLNTAARRGQYSTDLWIEHAGAPLEQLDARWKESLAEKLER